MMERLGTVATNPEERGRLGHEDLKLYVSNRIEWSLFTQPILVDTLP